MKFLFTLCFLAISGLAIYVGTKLQAFEIKQVKGSRRGAAGVYLLGLTLLVLVFFQFWMLTRVFPFYLILALIGASILAIIIYILIGAISGFTLPEKKQKIGALNVIWGSQNLKGGCVFLAGSLIIILISWIGSLWIFWRNPIGNSEAKVLIAFFLFTLPQLFRIPISFVLLWPTVTSEFLDDDLRNSHLASGFSNIIYSTIYLLFPIWLFKQEISMVFGSLPSFWILLSIPLLLFILVNVFPFFVGMYRFRSQAQIMIEWRKRWLNELMQLVKLPIGKARSGGLDEKLEDLESEIKKRFAENKLFHFYQSLVMPDIAHEDRLLPILPYQDQVEPEELLSEENHSEIAQIDEEPNIRKSIETAKEFLKGQFNYPDTDTEIGLQESVTTIIKENKSNLIEWDIRFAHLWRLLQLYEVAPEGKLEDISGFIKTCLEDVDREISSLSQKRNILAGTFLSAISAIIIWLFKTYQSEIINLVGELVR